MRLVACFDVFPAHARRRWLLAFLAALSMAASGSLATLSAVAQAVTVVDVVALAQGYRASALTGTAVKNAGGQEIGSIDDFIVDQEKVLYAIL